MINRFIGTWRALSTFHVFEPQIHYEGIAFNSVEAGFQAAKTTDMSIRQFMSSLEPRTAKAVGRSLPLRPDWEFIKEGVMYQLNWSKFEIPYLRQKLLATGEQELVEGNYWGDREWGVCSGVGQNKLGKILMRVRHNIRSSL